MDSNDKLLGFLAALLGFLTVAGGAFGAHGLEGSIPTRDLAAFDTGMRYGLIHAVAAVVALLVSQQGLAAARISGWAFIVGIVLFSGSLAFLGITGSRALVIVTPLGGLAFLAGWAFLCVGFIVQRNKDAR